MFDYAFKCLKDNETFVKYLFELCANIIPQFYQWYSNSQKGR